MRLESQKGFSVMELLVAMTLMSVIMTAAFAVLFSGVKAQGYGMDLTRAQEKANLAMQKLTSDLRDAGSGCSKDDTIFQHAGKSTVSFLRAVPNDSLPILVTYLLRDDPRRPDQKLLIRCTGDDSIGCVISNQVSEFSLDYLDGEGRSLLDHFADEPAVSRRPYHADVNRNRREDILDIRRVSIRIRTSTKPTRRGRQGTCELESEVAPRNILNLAEGGA